MSGTLITTSGDNIYFESIYDSGEIYLLQNDLVIFKKDVEKIEYDPEYNDLISIYHAISLGMED